MAEQKRDHQGESKQRTYRVGDVIKVKPAGIVIRPDGSTHVVIRGAYYLDQVGTFLVEGTEVTVA